MKQRACVFTLQRDEVHQLPHWWHYYRQHFVPQDMYVLDHDSSEPNVIGLLQEMRNHGARIFPVHHQVIFNHEWLTNIVVQRLSDLLLTYQYVLFTDVDELVMPAQGTLRDFILNARDECYRCTGYEIIGDFMYRSEAYDKTLLTQIPLRYVPGYHHCMEQPPTPNPNLMLYHLHRISYDEALEKNWRWERQNCWDPSAITGRMSIQNQLVDLEEFTHWFYSHNTPLEPWDPQLRKVLWEEKAHPLSQQLEIVERYGKYKLERRS